jgi:transcription elongation factor Elf1
MYRSLPKVKCCTFCGGDRYSIHGYQKPMFSIWLSCNHCGQDTRVFHSRKEAIEYWNRMMDDQEKRNQDERDRVRTDP